MASVTWGTLAQCQLPLKARQATSSNVHLNRLSEVVAAALLLDDVTVHLAGGDVVLAREADGQVALVVAQVCVASIGVRLAVMIWRLPPEKGRNCRSSEEGHLPRSTSMPSCSWSKSAFPS